MGAWIEITGFTYLIQLDRVAPLVGAWIEIKAFTGDFKTFFVAPLVGAWIEISLLNVNCAYLSSLLSWERGLKSYFVTINEL